MKREENNNIEVKLRSEAYNNHNSELIEKREKENTGVMWGFVLGFLLFFIILILVVLFVK